MLVDTWKWQVGGPTWGFLRWTLSQGTAWNGPFRRRPSPVPELRSSISLLCAAECLFYHQETTDIEQKLFYHTFICSFIHLCMGGDSEGTGGSKDSEWVLYKCSITIHDDRKKWQDWTKSRMWHIMVINNNRIILANIAKKTCPINSSLIFLQRRFLFPEFRAVRRPRVRCLRLRDEGIKLGILLKIWYITEKNKEMFDFKLEIVISRSFLKNYSKAKTRGPTSSFASVVLCHRGLSTDYLPLRSKSRDDSLEFSRMASNHWVNNTISTSVHS